MFSLSFRLAGWTEMQSSHLSELCGKHINDGEKIMLKHEN